VIGAGWHVVQISLAINGFCDAVCAGSLPHDRPSHRGQLHPCNRMQCKHHYPSLVRVVFFSRAGNRSFILVMKRKHERECRKWDRENEVTPQKTP